MLKAFELQKLIKAHLIFTAKNNNLLYFICARWLKELVTIDFVKLTMLWTTGPMLLLWTTMSFN